MNRSSNPRYWSNDELKKFAKLFNGNILNISGGKDADKEGQTYRAYFENAVSYSISNYDKSLNGTTENKLYLDLGSPLQADSDLINKFDVVFSHTVLEHVYDFETAIQNLCSMSRDIVITVVPFLQPFHHNDEKYYPGDCYHDYWRFSPYAIVNLLKKHGLKTIYISWNDDPIGNIYIFHIASKHPEKWPQIANRQKNIGERYGPGFYHQRLISRSCTDGSGLIVDDFVS